MALPGTSPAGASGPDGTLLGRDLVLTVGAPAHGGFCVARVDDDPHGRVVFVRHALPGEQVRVRVTEDGGGSYCRADAVEVLVASPDRVTPPCPHAGAGGCGGCDWQHATADAQRAMKASVVREQLARLAGIDHEVTVEALPGGLLGWRTRTTYAADHLGVLGLRKHRSHEVVTLARCPIGAPGIGDADALGISWPGATAVEVARGQDDVTAVLVHETQEQRRTAPAQRRRPSRRPADRVRPAEGPATLRHTAGGREFDVAAGGFWQGHRAAADAFTDCVLAFLAPRPGDVVVDLYAGAGLFAACLGVAVGPTGRVTALEASAAAVADAERSTADLDWVQTRRGVVDAASVQTLVGDADLVVLDPPRSGAGGPVMRAVLAGPARAVCYVACDPAALARDLGTAQELGWRLAQLRAFDAFPMTHHVECIALLVPESAPVGS